MPDISLLSLAVHQLTGLWGCRPHALRGTSRQGFEAEWREIHLMVIEGGLFTRSEMFDESDLDTALARFDDVTRRPHGSRMRQLANMSASTVLRHRRLKAFACFFGVAVYLLAQLLIFALAEPGDSIYPVSNTLQWMPALYVAAFMLFPRRRALFAAGVTFVLSAIVLGSAAIVSARTGDPRVPALLVNAIAAHLLTLMLLSMVVMLRHEFERVSLHARVMEDAANTDPLTGVPNRRALEDWLVDWEAQPRRATAVLILFDIDHFKIVNDAHGHLVGDEILVSTAQLIGSQLRSQDLFGRWGGEEFLVILDGATQAEARALADRVRQIVHGSVHPVAGAVTLSAGIAICSSGEPAVNAFRAADAALYAAKAAGRNRVEVV